MIPGLWPLSLSRVFRSSLSCEKTSLLRPKNQDKLKQTFNQGRNRVGRELGCDWRVLCSHSVKYYMEKDGLPRNGSHPKSRAVDTSSLVTKDISREYYFGSAGWSLVLTSQALRELNASAEWTAPHKTAGEISLLPVGGIDILPAGLGFTHNKITNKYRRCIDYLVLPMHSCPGIECQSIGWAGQSLGAIEM